MLYPVNADDICKICFPTYESLFVIQLFCYLVFIFATHFFIHYYFHFVQHYFYARALGKYYMSKLESS